MVSQRFKASRILGERLRDRRKALGLSQHELATLSRVDLANYGKVERGVGNPTLMTILQLSVTLEANPSDLLEGLADERLLPEPSHAYSVDDFMRENESNHLPSAHVG